MTKDTLNHFRKKWALKCTIKLGSLQEYNWSVGCCHDIYFQDVQICLHIDIK